MDRTLHDAQNAKKILQITADTMILVDQDGTCVDIDTHSSLWFLQEEKLLGKNIFDLLPLYTRQKLVPIFRQVIDKQKSVSKNYKLELTEGTYYFKCIMYPYEDKVLCQYRDITARSNVKLQLERTNHELRFKRLPRSDNGNTSVKNGCSITGDTQVSSVEKRNALFQSNVTMR